MRSIIGAGRRAATFRNGRKFYGIELAARPGFRRAAVLRSVFSFLGLDPRGLRDRYADYWQQNVAHVLINREHCIRNPHGFAGYGADCWGLTSSDDHLGYNVHAPDHDLGVITPTAALASFPYAPEHCMRALRHFYQELGDRIWGDYGFVDAFSETHDWYASSHLAIDQGPIVVMIENWPHRPALGPVHELPGDPGGPAQAGLRESAPAALRASGDGQATANRPGGRRPSSTRSIRARSRTATAMASAISPASCSAVDYLSWLGVDAVWICPIYPSPMADFGYDVADYTGIDPLFGTHRRLRPPGRGAARARHPPDPRLRAQPQLGPASLVPGGARVARRTRGATGTSGAIPDPDGGPPNNWVSQAGGSAWELDPATGQYYYHAFLKEQPDLNWRNPAVRQAMYDALRFWLDSGVDGFRVDVLWHMIKDAEFRDDPWNPNYIEGQPDFRRRACQQHSADQPEVLEIAQEMRRVLGGVSGRAPADRRDLSAGGAPGRLLRRRSRGGASAVQLQSDVGAAGSPPRSCS